MSKKKVSVKDKLQGNELDLSLLELSEVPVKEMAAVPRGTVVDLSNNKLVTLPLTFPSLVHIVKLDLSNNHITSLPPNFGDLRNLKHLDLYNNKLERVPVSFYQLKELRWLDLKNNPLVPTLAEAAGSCLDSKECHEAARKVVKLMAMVHSELEKKRLQEEEEQKAWLQAQQLKANREKEELRQQKKLSKEKQKMEGPKTNPPPNRSAIKTIKNELQAENNKTQQTKNNRITHQKAQKQNTGSSWLTNFLYMVLRLLTLAVIFISVLLAFHWEGPLTYENLIVVSDRTYDNVSRHFIELREWSLPYLQRMQHQWKQFSRFMAENGRDILMSFWYKVLDGIAILQKQALELMTLLWQRLIDLTAQIGSEAPRVWEAMIQQAPIYYNLAHQQLHILYNSTVSLFGN